MEGSESSGITGGFVLKRDYHELDNTAKSSRKWVTNVNTRIPQYIIAMTRVVTVVELNTH